MGPLGAWLAGGGPEETCEAADGEEVWVCANPVANIAIANREIVNRPAAGWTAGPRLFPTRLIPSRKRTRKAESAWEAIKITLT
jgi:hypothetical protein